MGPLQLSWRSGFSRDAPQDLRSCDLLFAIILLTLSYSSYSSTGAQETEQKRNTVPRANPETPNRSRQQNEGISRFVVVFDCRKWLHPQVRRRSIAVGSLEEFSW